MDERKRRKGVDEARSLIQSAFKKYEEACNSGQTHVFGNWGKNFSKIEELLKLTL